MRQSHERGAEKTSVTFCPRPTFTAIERDLEAVTGVSRCEDLLPRMVGYPPPPRGVRQAIHFMGPWGTVKQVLPSGRDEAVADGQKAAIAGWGFEPSAVATRSHRRCEGRVQESQRAAVWAWAEDGMPCKRKALFAFGADRAFPIVRVRFLRWGGKEIRRGWRYEGTAERSAAGKSVGFGRVGVPRSGARSDRTMEGAARRCFCGPTEVGP